MQKTIVRSERTTRGEKLYVTSTTGKGIDKRQGLLFQNECSKVLLKVLVLLDAVP
jgi:hypothetical protein